MTIKLIRILIVTAGLVSSLHSMAQNSAAAKPNKIVIITGARFTYPLVQKWIDDYGKVKPSVQIIIDARGTTDPAQYDILVEAHEQAEEIRQSRQYLYVARYAVLPVANSKSAFTKAYAQKGINQDLINQLFFHDIYADKEKEQVIKYPYTIYTRLQKAGAPIVFTKYFGFEQKDIRGKAIAGSDEHLLKALLRDSTAVSYLPLTLIYDHASGKTIAGISVLPVDFNGNGKISDDERFYDNLGDVIQRLENKDPKDVHNLPIGYIHLSVSKEKADPEAVEFLLWLTSNGQADLHNFGFIAPEPAHSEKEKFQEFASKRIKP